MMTDAAEKPVVNVVDVAEKPNTTKLKLLDSLLQEDPDQFRLEGYSLFQIKLTAGAFEVNSGVTVLPKAKIYIFPAA